jgi:hypothetical protein
MAIMSGGAGDRSSLDGVGIRDRVKGYCLLASFLCRENDSLALPRPAVAFSCNYKQTICLVAENDLFVKCKATGSHGKQGVSPHLPVRPPVLAKPTDEATLFGSIKRLILVKS